MNLHWWPVIEGMDVPSIHLAVLTPHPVAWVGLCHDLHVAARAELDDPNRQISGDSVSLTR